MRSISIDEMHNYAATAMPAQADAATTPQSASVADGSAIKGKRAEKYALRRRQKRKWTSEDATLSESHSDHHNHHLSGRLEQQSTKTKRSKKNGQRERIASSSSFANETAATTKAKVKAAPLSKYRRKTANARERSRMREINSAFETLRHRVPLAIAGEAAASSNEKLTKITTLRLAMKYIRLLDDALNETNPDFQLDFLWDSSPDTQYSPEDATTSSASDSSSVASKPVNIPKKLNARSKANKTAPATSKSARSVATNPSQTPLSNKLQKKRRPKANSSKNTTVATVHERPSRPRHRENDMIFIERSAHSEISQSLSDLSTLMLESDCESSLHLSENCLSPLHSQQAFDRLLGSATQAKITASSALDSSSLSLSPSSAMAENHHHHHHHPFELALSLLDSTDSTADSLDLVTDQQSTPVSLSPLIGAPYDAFNPFSDLLHADFADHNALDLFSA